MNFSITFLFDVLVPVVAIMLLDSVYKGLRGWKYYVFAYLTILVLTVVYMVVSGLLFRFHRT